MNKFEEARELLVNDLRSYLVGPAEGVDEQIPERASDRYHVGILWPSGSEIDGDEDDISDGTDVGSDAKPGDGVFALANASQQSAMGFTFQLPEGVPIIVEGTWAEYISREKTESKKIGKVDSSAASTKQPMSDEAKIGQPIAPVGDSEPDGGNKSKRHRIDYIWQRMPVTTGIIKLPSLAEYSATPQRIWSQNDIELILLERRIEGVRILTISLVSRRKRPQRKEKSAENTSPTDLNIYQVNLKVRSANGGAVFMARPGGQFVSDPEFQVHELLYRNVRQFAVGHGCSVDWTIAEQNSPSASEIHAEWIPATEVYKASSEVKALAKHPALSLSFIIKTDRDEVVAKLREIPKAYGDWIHGLSIEIDKIVAEFKPGLREQIRDVAKDNLEKCRVIRDRIIEGINLLETDDNAYHAFVLANRAMSKSMAISRPNDDPRWHPFQLAFLLLAIPSTAYGDNHARNILDLIWFPTGGGKTEAYLGLVAFTLFFRRLDGDSPEGGYGTAVITRYTLRLLTMQQFERAARAVMACEILRREDEKRFGTEPFSIGLFVGNSATPGTIESAISVINGTSEDKSLTTLPVVECPWCRTQLVSGRDQKADARAKKVSTKCSNVKCDFHHGIPISCVDEELYQHPPSMVIGTVDKFAMMAWRPEIGSLFGIGRSVKPPTLIIQDELHLIGDALGSMTGLYETAFDMLCSDKGVLPKIVGSTATIRRAEKQVHAVFLRKVAQFPPSGLNQEDAFFYREERNVPGRLYVGVHAQGRSPKHTLARLIGILGQGANAIADLEAQDHFWTLVTYFNSLRELGGAWVLGLDDVPKYVKAMPRKRNKKDRALSQITELTSHLPSTEIPVVLKNISLGKNSEDLDREPVDLLLCTNMISVGVDIDRLGLMVINGQPKTTAEYIQASSRVGRPKGAAGLVVALYNWTRPRDRSHYERFRTYHESFYRNVEATSVTPFSARARDKALHGVLVALIRLKINQLSGSPVLVSDDKCRIEIEALMDDIAKRARGVTGSEEIEMETREDLDRILSYIKSVGRANGVWSKGHEKQKATARFMRRPNEAAGISGGVETPQSMRDVDPPCSIELRSLVQIKGVPE